MFFADIVLYVVVVSLLGLAWHGQHSRLEKDEAPCNMNMFSIQSRPLPPPPTLQQVKKQEQGFHV